jgi:hypothetical protein
MAGAYPLAQPTPYTRAYNFTNFQATSPSTPLPADQVDAEFNRIKTTFDQTLANIALIQRDDGKLANASVGLDQLAADAVSGINIAKPWATATAYTVGNIVFQSGSVYYCQTAHTSGTFDTDLAAGKWVSLGTIGSVTSIFGRSGDVVAVSGDYNATQVTFTPAGTIAATNVQSAIAELESEVYAALDNKQPLNSNVTTIAGLTPTTDNVIQSVAGAWASRTPTQLLATILTGAADDDVIQRKAGAWTNRTMAQLATDIQPHLSTSGNFTEVDLGGTTDTTLSRSSAGVLAVEGGSGKIYVNAVELGSSGDTTLARSSAGNVSIEGNVVYRAGGTDVAVADGGTGASTAADGARALLNGLGATKGNILWYNGTQWTVLAP